MGPQHMPLLSVSTSKAQPNQYTPHISLNYAYSWPFGGVDWVFSPTSSEPSPIRFEEDSRVGWSSFTDNEERLSAVGREEHSHQGSQQSVETVLGGLQAEVMMTVMDAEREQPVLRSALKMDVVERVWRASRNPDGSSGMRVMCEAAAATTTELTSSSTPAWAAPMLAWTRRLKKKAAQADDRPAKKAKTLKREITLHAIVTNPSVKTQHD